MKNKLAPHQIARLGNKLSIKEITKIGVNAIDQLIVRYDLDENIRKINITQLCDLTRWIIRIYQEDYAKKVKWYKTSLPIRPAEGEKCWLLYRSTKKNWSLLIGTYDEKKELLKEFWRIPYEMFDENTNLLFDEVEYLAPAEIPNFTEIKNLDF